MTEQVLDDMEQMLDFRPHAGLEMLQFFKHGPSFVFGQRFAFGTLYRHVPGHRFAEIFHALFNALVIIPKLNASHCPSSTGAFPDRVHRLCSWSMAGRRSS